MDDPDRGPADDVWDDLLEDADAIAEEYRDAGWEAVRPAVGDVTPATGEGFGLDVLIPDSDYRVVADAVDGVEFGGSDVYSRTVEDVVYLIVVNQSADDVAVIVPSYYDLTAEAGAAMLSRARETGRMQTHLRALPQDELLTFAHAEPSLFVPDESVAATLDRESVPPAE